jgi:hypothetical protein
MAQEIAVALIVLGCAGWIGARLWRWTRPRPRHAVERGGEAKCKGCPGCG